MISLAALALGLSFVTQSFADKRPEMLPDLQVGVIQRLGIGCTNLETLRRIIHSNQSYGAQPQMPPGCGPFPIMKGSEVYLHPIEGYPLTEYISSVLGDVIIFQIRKDEYVFGYVAVARIVSYGNAV